jgi:hypothetical protein
MRTWKIAVICLATLASLAIGSCWILSYVLFREVRQREAEVTESRVAQTALRDLAVLCQTCREHPDWFSHEPSFAPAWMPASVLNLKPTWVGVTPDDARVEFGGGFHHFGYSVAPAPSPTGSDASTTWVLTFYSDSSPERELGRLALVSSDVLTEGQFVDRAMAEFDRRIAANDDSRIVGDNDVYASVQRCKFAIKHRQIPRLRHAIRETAQHNADAWRDVLLAFVIDFPADSGGAAERLRQWADAKSDFSAWLMAAYAFDKVGALDAAEDAVLRACKTPADDPPWTSRGARTRGYSMCRRLYVAGRFKTCVVLCDTLLAYQAAQNYGAGSLAALRDACHSAQARSTSQPLPAAETGTNPDFDPFAGIDINALQDTREPQARLAPKSTGARVPTRQAE